MQEWYLMASPTLTSGDERDIIEEYGSDSVLEMLESVGERIELYNYDLSEMTECKALVIGKAQDTKLKALNRRIIVPIGSCRAGMYVKYDNRFWLIVGLVDTNMIYEKAVLTLCNYKLTWIGTNGNVVQRWAAIESASQYNNGETGQQYYRVRSDQLLVVIPDDKESLLLDTGVRFVIDRRTEIYEEEIGEETEIDTSHNLFIYEVTRSDTVLYNYQGSGHSEFLASQDEQRSTDGYYKVDGVGYWLAPSRKQNKNQIMPDDVSCNIVPINETLFIDVEPAVFIGVVYDDNGKEADIELRPENWDIEFVELDKLNIDYVENTIQIGADDMRLAGKEITLNLRIDENTSCSRKVQIQSLI